MEDQNQNTVPNKQSYLNIPLLSAGITILILSCVVSYLLGQRLQIVKQGTVNVPTQMPMVTQVKIESTPVITPRITESINDWKIYIDPYLNATFSYPANWQIKSINTVDSNVKGVELDSPEGLQIQYAPTVSGLGGGCDPADCPMVKTRSVKKIDNTNSKSDLYLVEGKVNETKRFGLMSSFKSSSLPEVGEKKQFPYYMLFFTPKETLAWFMVTAMEDKYMKISDEEYFNLPEVKIAEQILSSFKYK